MGDKPEVTLELVTDAIAGALGRLFGDGAPVYASPITQAASLPCWFVNYSKTQGARKEIGNRYVRELAVDLAYLREFGEPGLYRRYRAAAELLDERLELLRYGDGAALRTYGREWEIAPDALHYRFTLKLRASMAPPEGAEKMERMGIDIARKGQ
ncbi:MAG: hypothetical protein LBJ10_03020 [Clostridiales bacterium]|jgi:hypothetical protein|nr:hypothetical protein [Clostridiales bacterium]